MFEVEGSGWRASFQRRVADDVGANRGALSCHELSKANDRTRVLVPLPAGEALWVAWMLDAGLTVAGRMDGDRALRIVPVTQSARSSLVSADAFFAHDGPRPIDAAAVTLADTRAAADHEHLSFTVRDAQGREIAHLDVVLASSALYQAMSGRAAPQPTSQSDAYGGWRLP